MSHLLILLSHTIKFQNSKWQLPWITGTFEDHSICSLSYWYIWRPWNLLLIPQNWQCRSIKFMITNLLHWIKNNGRIMSYFEKCSTCISFCFQNYKLWRKLKGKLILSSNTFLCNISFKVDLQYNQL